jgi:hypothetical protein
MLANAADIIFSCALDSKEQQHWNMKLHWPGYFTDN